MLRFLQEWKEAKETGKKCRLGKFIRDKFGKEAQGQIRELFVGHSKYYKYYKIYSKGSKMKSFHLESKIMWFAFLENKSLWLLCGE